MFDPAALGTLMIGLESVRKDSEWSEPTARRPRGVAPRPVNVPSPPGLRPAIRRRSPRPPVAGAPGVLQFGGLNPFSKSAVLRVGFVSPARAAVRFPGSSARAADGGETHDG